MKAFVICCNDGIQEVVLGDEKLAEKRLEKLSKLFYKKNFHSYPKETYEEFRKSVYWHIHEVPIYRRINNEI